MTNRNDHASVYVGNLRERLRLNGISFGALSRKTGIDVSQISRWMNGRSRPNERSIARMEAAIAAIRPSATLTSFTAPGAIQDDERSELIRLREYVSEFRSLIDIHDRTPYRWRYFQGEWMWMFARGMIEGASPAEVKSRRIGELKVKDKADPEEAVLLHESMNGSIGHFMKADLYGGPADGLSSFLRVPVTDDIVVYVPSRGGDVSVAGYRRATGATGDILGFVAPDGGRDSLPDKIEDAFAGKKAAKYIYCEMKEAYDADAGDGD